MKTLIIDVKNLMLSKFFNGRENHKYSLLGKFLNNLLCIQEEIEADKFLFCFDSIHYFRKDIYPSYKNRESKDIKTISNMKRANILVKELKDVWLKSFGFSNAYEQYGLEADDLIAQYCQTSLDDDIIIASSDRDMYQLIEEDSDRIQCYSPYHNKIFNNGNIKEEWGIIGKHFGLMKCIAGCNSDKVKGIKGIGDARATAYINGKLDSKWVDKIESEDCKHIIKRNRDLVLLPYPKARIVDVKCNVDKLYIKDFVKTFFELNLRKFAKENELSRFVDAFKLE